MPHAIMYFYCLIFITLFMGTCVRKFIELFKRIAWNSSLVEHLMGWRHDRAGNMQSLAISVAFSCREWQKLQSSVTIDMTLHGIWTGYLTNTGVQCYCCINLHGWLTLILGGALLRKQFLVVFLGGGVMLTLNIPSLGRQRCLPSWGPRRTPWFFCNFWTVWCGRLLKLCFSLGFWNYNSVIQALLVSNILCLFISTEFSQ